MASHAECLAALPDFRNDLLQRQLRESITGPAAPFAVRGAFSAFATPANNVHATGVGIRRRAGKYDPNEHVLKMYVFHKLSANDPGALPPQTLRGIPVDVEELPVQTVRGGAPAAALPVQRQRHRPVVGGISISPLNAQFVGTLGCFLRRKRGAGEEILALSNNHVLADTNSLPRGTPIVQPGPETPPFVTPEADVFATLRSFIPIQFPSGEDETVTNRFDAAVATVTDRSLIATGRMLGIVQFDASQVAAPVPGMRVIKSGRTSGVTRGTITATHVNGTQVNYAEQGQPPRIATYIETIEIAGDGGPFSRPGDSGSVILEEATGRPVALLFAGDGVTTTACDFGALCTRLRALPA